MFVLDIVLAEKRLESVAARGRGKQEESEESIVFVLAGFELVNLGKQEAKNE